MPGSIEEIASSVARGDVSPRDVLDGCLARIQELEPALHAFLHIDAHPGAAEGPLAGIPIAIKDLIDVSGMPTTAASKILNVHPAHDSPWVSRLREAGAAIVGKTNLDEFAYGVFSPPTRNPWDLERSAGGSSGGSAAAVAAGLCLGALGTDTAGSLRLPAALCGVAALMPRKAQGPARTGIWKVAPSLDSIGPVARSVRDVAHLWNVLAGHPTGAPPKRVGICRGLASGEIEAAYDEAISAVDCDVVEVDLPPFEEWERPRGYLLMVEALEEHRRAGFYPDRSLDYTPDVLNNLRFAEQIKPDRFASEMEHLEVLRGRFMASIEDVDALLLPTTLRTAPLSEEVDADLDARRAIVGDLTRLLGPINCLPLAAVTLPWALSSARLPIGMDVVARDESCALALAGSLDRSDEVGVPEILG